MDQFEPGTSQGAQAAEYAGDQNAFWPYHDRLFVASREQRQEGFIIERLIEYAEELSLNKDAFEACLMNQTYGQLVQETRAEGIALEVQPTPTVIINGRIMIPLIL